MKFGKSLQWGPLASALKTIQGCYVDKWSLQKDFETQLCYIYIVSQMVIVWLLVWQHAGHVLVYSHILILAQWAACILDLAILNPLLTLMIFFCCCDWWQIFFLSLLNSHNPTKGLQSPGSVFAHFFHPFLLVFLFFYLDVYQIQPRLAAVLCSVSHNQYTEILSAYSPNSTDF